MVAMDVLAGLLEGPRARGAFLLRASMDPPWALQIRDGSPLTVLAVVRGWAWVGRDGNDPVCLRDGAVAVVRGPDHYTVADDPGTAPTVVIGPGQVCTHVADGRSLVDEWDRGVRTWGTSADGHTVLLIGTYERAGEISRSLLAAIPPVLALSRADWDSPLVALLAAELARDLPGQRVVLDRLLDLTLIAILRTWFARQQEAAPAWFRASADPVVGKALRSLHHAPERPWTVAALAAQTNTSRATFARRFTGLVGEPPMSYLTRWRLALAADLLCQPGSTLGAVARQVGYRTSFALSAAFKRHRGISPQQYRESAQ